MSIWLIKEAYWRDSYNGDYLEEVHDTDLGYFTSQDAAQAYCDEKNSYKRRQYDEYVTKIHEQAATYKELYAKAMKRYQALIAAGFTDERKPQEPVTKKIQTYEEFAASHSYGWSTYATVEIEPFAAFTGRGK